MECVMAFVWSPDRSSLATCNSNLFFRKFMVSMGFLIFNRILLLVGKLNTVMIGDSFYSSYCLIVMIKSWVTLAVTFIV